MPGAATGRAGGDIGADLRRFSLFAGVGAETIGLLAAQSRRMAWPAGKILFQRGDAGDVVYAITSDRVRISLGSSQGKELVIRHLTAGEILGELAIIDGQDRSADAMVMEPTSAIVLTRAAFLAVAETRADLGLALARHLSGLLRSTNFQMESIAIYDLKMRVIRYLLMSLHQLHGEVLPEEATLRFGFNQSDLSAILGASRPKVNRVLQDLIAAGHVRRNGTDLVCHPARLRESAADGLDAEPE